jgi:DNA-binding transcriptional ArsR family regulator
LSVLGKIQALSNATRFEIVKLVREREMAAGTIARRFKLTRPAVSQHIGVLREAGLLNERRVGSQRLYVVRTEGFDELAEFVEGFWRPRLQRLKQAAEAAERGKTK